MKYFRIFKITFISNIIGIFITSNILNLNAQSLTVGKLQYSEENIKTIVMALFVIIIIIFFFICSAILVFSKNQEKRDFASSTITGLNGFFIGTITGWLT